MVDFQFVRSTEIKLGTFDIIFLASIVISFDLFKMTADTVSFFKN